MAETHGAASAAILQMTQGLWLSPAIWRAARLCLDAIGEEPVAIGDLASRNMARCLTRRASASTARRPARRR